MELPVCATCHIFFVSRGIPRDYCSTKFHFLFGKDLDWLDMIVIAAASTLCMITIDTILRPNLWALVIYVVDILFTLVSVNGSRGTPTVIFRPRSSLFK